MDRPSPVLPLPRRRLGRTLALLLATSGLGACVAQQGTPGYGRLPAASGQAPALAPPAGRRVAVLLPLSGANAQLGQSMLLAARLAFQPGPANPFDTQDTKGTAQGAIAAATAAAASGAGLIVGPLTAVETAAITPFATSHNIPVLAFSSDGTKARSGIWPLGLTPAQQARTLVRASLADNKRRIGAILPSDAFGDSLAAGLAAAAAEAALPPPTILRYQSRAGLDSAITRMSTPAPSGPVVSPIPGLPASTQPPVDALLLGTVPDATLQVLPSLVAAGLGPDRVRILGTALWARDAARLAPLAGAWFAGPPAGTLKVFEDNYIAQYGTPPRDIASVAFDAAGAARAASGPNGIELSTLLNPSGFSGANGVFRLLPDGTVRRTLAIFEIGAGGVRMRDAPPENGSPFM